MWLTLGQSQAMKTAWAEDLLGMIPPAALLEDPGFDDAQKRLEDALTNTGVDHVVETYNARHGWEPSDTPVHDAAATEKPWRTLFELLDGTLSS